MSYRGRFILSNGIILPNVLIDTGEEAFLKMLFRDDQTIVAGGGNFYCGLTKVSDDDTLTFAAITVAEPSGNGYARQAIERNSTGWPTLAQLNGDWGITSKTLTFSASGGDYDKVFTRPFLCNVLTGTSGIVFALGSALAIDQQLTDGNSFQMTYQAVLY